MKLGVFIIFGLLATAINAITYPQDYIIVDNVNFYAGDQFFESCTSEQELISKAIPWIGQNPLLGVTWEENQQKCFFKILTQTNAQPAFDQKNHDKVHFLFYAEIFQENYGLLRGIDFTGSDIASESSKSLDEALQKSVAYMNKDSKKTITFTRDRIWFKNILKVNPGVSGNHEICSSVIYGRQLKYNTKKFQHDYFLLNNLDFTGGDISSEKCDSLENAKKRVPQLIQENPNYAATYVDDQKTLYFKILQRTNPSAVDQNTHNRCKSFIYAEVLKDNVALIRGINFPGGNIKDEQVKNDDEAIQKALGSVNVDNFVCWQKRENRFSHTFYYQTLRKSNPSSAGVWKTSTTCVFQATDLNIVPEETLQYQLDCAVLYDECGFKGNSYNLCDDAPVLPDKFTVKSVRVPKGFNVEVYADPQYKGGKKILDRDAECLQLSDFQ